VALDVFIHDYGRRTFTGLGIDTQKQLEENFVLFKKKCGPEHVAGYRLPEKPIPAPTAIARCCTSWHSRVGMRPRWGSMAAAQSRPCCMRSPGDSSVMIPSPVPGRCKCISGGRHGTGVPPR
jgi:hypothetical protein